MDRGGPPRTLRDQRAELRPLQNLRHQGPEPEHHVGATRGRRRAELSEHVIAHVTMLPYRTFQWAPTCSKWANLAACARQAMPAIAALRVYKGCDQGL